MATTKKTTTKKTTTKTDTAPVEESPEVIATPPDHDDTPEHVAWWNPATGRYVGGRHSSTDEPPAGVEVHPWDTGSGLNRPT
jgi:hypothetical protein